MATLRPITEVVRLRHFSFQGGSCSLQQGPLFGSPGLAPPTDVFLQGLSETGWVEGQNVAIEYRWAEGRYDRLPAFADLVGRKVDVILAAGDAAAAAANGATATIPIVFISGDPVGNGLVASLARPGGNLTGVSLLTVELMAKRLELLSELVPQAGVIALLVNPNTSTTERMIRDEQEAARAKGVQLHVVKAGSESEIDAAFASLAQLQAGALLVSRDPFFNSRRVQLVALPARHAVPAIYPWREFTAAGGLRTEPHGRPSPGRHLHRKDPQGHQAGRSAGRAADQVRARRESQDRQGARSDDPAGVPRPRRRGDRMRRRELVLLMAGAMTAARPLRAQQKAAPVSCSIYFGGLPGQAGFRLSCVGRGYRLRGEKSAFQMSNSNSSP